VQTQVCVSPRARGPLAQRPELFVGLNGSLVGGNFHTRVGLVPAADKELLFFVGYSHNGKAINAEAFDRLFLVELTQKFVSNPPGHRALTEHARWRTHGYLRADLKGSGRACGELCPFAQTGIVRSFAPLRKRGL